jgi:hypothetical protein
MGTVRTHLVAGLLGAVVGVIVTVLALSIEEPDPSRVGDRVQSPADRETRVPANRRTPGEADDDEVAAPAVTGVTAASLGTEATDEELAFLREALAADRKRRLLAAEDAAEQARQAPVRSEDDGLAVMDRYLNSGGDVTDVVASYAAMRAHVRTDPGPVRRIASQGKRTEVDLTSVSEDHAVLEFGEGTFVLDRGSKCWNTPDGVVKSLEIRGAGIEQTRLIGPGWAFLCAGKKTVIRNLVIRDLTLDSLEKGQIPLSARGGISAALERVRFAGWNVAGHAAALGVSGSAFLAIRDCEFLGDGWVLSLRGPGLAVFDRCRFHGARAVLIADSHRKGRPAVVRLNDCTFGTVPVTRRDLRMGKEGGADVVIRGGTAVGGPVSWTKAERWEHFGADKIVSMVGLTFLTKAPPFSVEDAVRALDIAASVGLRDVVELRVPSMRTKPLELDFFVLDRESGGLPIRHTFVFDGSSLVRPAQDPRRGERGSRGPEPETFDACLSFGELLRRANIAADETVHRIYLRGSGPSAVCIIQLTDSGHLSVNAITGEVPGRR